MTDQAVLDEIDKLIAEQIIYDDNDANRIRDQKVYEKAHPTKAKADKTILSSRIGVELTSRGFNNLQRAPFLYLNAHPNNYNVHMKETLRKTTPDVPKDYDLLRTAFFSKENIEIINKQLIMYIFHQTEKTFLIPPQREEWLKLPMLYIYNFWSQNLPFKITDQIRELNKKTVLEVGPQIISQLEQYTAYMRDISRPAPWVPIDRPVNVSSSGNRTLPSVMTRLRVDDNTPFLDSRHAEI